MSPVDDCLAVRGLGLRLPGVAGAAELATLVAGAAPPPAPVRRFVAPETDLAPLDRRTYAPVAPRIPASVAGRGLRALPAESLLALAAAADADAMAPGGPPVPWPGTFPPDPAGADSVEPDPVGAGLVEAGPAAVLWASSSAGLAEYATICVQAATMEPGLSSPIIGPASAFNGPAATVSIRLGLDGPNETTTGGCAAGLTALVEAARLVADGEAGRALVGGSATVSRWSLAGLAEEFVAAEGAACLAVAPCRDGEPGIRLGRFRRTSLDRSDLAAQCRALVRAARPAGSGRTAGPVPATPPARRTPERATPAGGVAGGPAGVAPVVVSTVDSELVEALAGEAGRQVWHLERSLGDFGAAGGLLAAACAVAYCASVPAPASLLVLAVEPSGNAAILEVFSWSAPTSSSGWWGGHSPPVEASGSHT
ncbi:beta-ketoacyl synthase N-terminal-like domain-containing protein [Plantactinospora sp. WMMB782]|uniref:beta-ketoacyl synthase N-terminal-like domain-containing protein n=1 Tax=Plantactinospora sp. WMMB782 TaxID=3404121 RepID=UPI003B9594E9